MSQRSDYLKILEYILQRASAEEIRGIEMALERRRSEMPAGTADLDFQNMASRMASKVGASLDFDVKGMSRRLVAEMILQQYPNISDRELEALLNQFIPDRSQGGAPAEGLQLPREVRMSMLDQFIRYSIGRMPAEELADLKKASPEWVSKYWNAFDRDTRALLSRLLKGEIDTDDFWKTIEKI